MCVCIFKGVLVGFLVEFGRMGGKSFRDVVEEMKPAALLVLVQVVSAVLNILYKLALNDGMDARVLVAYRYVFAVAFMGPLAFFLER